MKLTPLLACLLAALPAAALADSHGGDHASARSAPAPRAYQSAPRYQAAAPRYQQQAPRYQQQAPRYQQQAPRYQQQQAPRYQQQTWNSAPRSTTYRNVQPLPRYQARPVEQHYAYNGYNGGDRVGYNRSYGSGYRVEYRGYNANPWAWNGGRAWVASPGYWAGGFWGGLSLGLSVNDYVAQPDSPGYDLLNAYGLQQTDCDQPNLVQIDGPDGSEICAYPNDQVAPGAYQVDPSTLTLVSQ